MRLFRQVAIVGVGLIGGSIGLAIKKKHIAEKVIGIGRHQEAIDEALKKGAIDEGYLDLERTGGANLVILATPVNEIIRNIPELSALRHKGCIVIDVGSTKSEIMASAEKTRLNFIGCHPMAGMEKKGAKNAKSTLFKNSLCIIVPAQKTKRAVLEKIKKFWETLGARTKVLDALTHDRILAFVSHLPHIVVFSLMHCIKAEYLPFAASGLKDTTRIGLSDPVLWKDIFLTNRREALRAVRDFKGSLACLELLIKKNQPQKLLSYLEKSRNKRNALAP